MKTMDKGEELTIDSLMVSLEAAESRAAKAEAACAEMRQALLNIVAGYKYDATTPSGIAIGEFCAADLRDAEHALSSSCGKDFVPRSELDKANAAIAEMRDWIELAIEENATNQLKHALESDRGKGWLPPDKTKVLVEALRKLADGMPRGDHLTESCAMQHFAQQALDAAAILKTEDE